MRGRGQKINTEEELERACLPRKETDKIETEKSTEKRG